MQLGRVSRAALRERLIAFATLVERVEADVVLCQEVGRGVDFRVDVWLAERLGMTAAYEPGNRVGDREEGVAILSRYPMPVTASTLLTERLWRRPALAAVLDTPLGELVVCTAHLSLRPWRNGREAERLRAWIEAMAGPRPAIIGGDFNRGERSATVRRLGRHWRDACRAATSTGAAYTHELRLFGRVVRRQRLDYVFLRPGAPELHIAGCEHRAGPKPFSDHLAVVARFS